MKRRLKSALDLVKPDLANKVKERQQKQKDNHDKRAKHREFDIGDNVYALIHARNNQTWIPATITAVTGPLSYVVMLADKREQRCHIDQLRKREATVTTDEPIMPTPIVPPNANITPSTSQTINQPQQKPVVPVTNEHEQPPQQSKTVSTPIATRHSNTVLDQQQAYHLIASLSVSKTVTLVYKVIIKPLVLLQSRQST